MNKAKERALKAYPLKMDGDIFGSYDLNLTKRSIYQQGYEQAEKDNELTWKDLKLLQGIFHEVFAEVAKGSVGFYQIYPTEQSFFEKILERFKEKKNEV